MDFSLAREGDLDELPLGIHAVSLADANVRSDDSGSWWILVGRNRSMDLTIPANHRTIFGRFGIGRLYRHVARLSVDFPVPVGTRTADFIGRTCVEHPMIRRQAGLRLRRTG
jgi:hypothetical protein